MVDCVSSVVAPKGGSANTDAARATQFVGHAGCRDKNLTVNPRRDFDAPKVASSDFGLVFVQEHPCVWDGLSSFDQLSDLFLSLRSAGVEPDTGDRGCVTVGVTTATKTEVHALVDEQWCGEDDAGECQQDYQ